MTTYCFEDGVVQLESDIAEEAMLLSRMPADERILDRELTEGGYRMTIRCEPPVCPDCNEVTRNYGDFCWNGQTVIGLSCDTCCEISEDLEGDDFGDDDRDYDLNFQASDETRSGNLLRQDQFYSTDDRTPIWFRNDVKWHKKFGANGE